MPHYVVRFNQIDSNSDVKELYGLINANKIEWDRPYLTTLYISRLTGLSYVKILSLLLPSFSTKLSRFNSVDGSVSVSSLNSHSHFMNRCAP